jgi:outer membrane protein assembly factor BamB
MNPLPMVARLLPLILAGLLAGCEIFPDYFGVTDDEQPLPGERIPILTLDRSIKADPGVSALPITLPPAQTNSDWRQAGGNAVHVLQHLELSQAFERRWRADIGEASDDDQKILAQPLVVDGRVYTMDSQAIVTAFDAGTGRQIWRSDLEPEDEDSGYFGGGIAYGDGRIYVTTGFSRLFALDAASGSPIWEQAVIAPFRGGPTFSEGRLYAISVDNQLHALDAATGEPLWSHGGIQETAGLLGGVSPAANASLVIPAYSSGEVFALLTENGRVLWSDSLAAVQRVDPIADLADIRGLPVLDRDLVIAVSNSGRMVAIDQRRGQRAWDIEVGGVNTPWVAGGFIYVVTNEAQVAAISREDGRIYWVQNLQRFEDEEDREDPITWYGPVLAGERLILAGTNGRMALLSPYDGEILRELELPGKTAVPPIVAGGTLYIVTDGADLLAYR